MKLHNPVQNQAVLSNVGEIGEFRIRNSAKAFSILSSGLYANKIRAIIRELSCNAVDSHTAANKASVPFDVHLPSTLEPWFSIRDYGTGLTHEQVTNIYTTYFESTKTDSNSFIGALGLGSKSPFSYTDNFTVTAIHDGRKGIYTAFINDQGVPSIALMDESTTEDPNGVEVKFSVNDRYDFEKFVSEAKNIYKYFKLRPVIHGVSNFAFVNSEYKDKDIIPGVHTRNGGRYSSVAVMGNIAYPIDVPQAESNLGDLRSMLECDLELEFGIGELDFQASREGLSYVPSTIKAIKDKLAALNAQLAIHIATEANKLTNLWDRADYLQTRYSQTLWKSAVLKYVRDTKFELANHSTGVYNLLQPFVLKVDDLKKKYNIALRSFHKDSHSDKCSNVKVEAVLDDVTKQYTTCHKIWPSKDVHFVFTDTKRGAVERAKYHWRNLPRPNAKGNVYVIEAADKTKKVELDSFLKDLYNPPRVLNASTLIEKESNSSGGNWGKASILRLEERRRSRYSSTMAWANGGTAGDYDHTKTYYYVEMNGWTPVGVPMRDIQDYYSTLRNSGVFIGTIYGVRKGDIAAIKLQKNWVELTQFVKNKLETMDKTHVMGLVKQAIDFNSFFKYHSDSINENSPYFKMMQEFKGTESVDSYSQHAMERLFAVHKVVTKSNVDVKQLIDTYKAKFIELKERYPLIDKLHYGASAKDVVEYINLIDSHKGI